ncbi:hypothetical protein B0H16DRAFT_1742986 [Mycena metata]|uniref:Uncharacterized protein n=1 Tax=Mycena metata TaxID=1033252 RepID=A0AAD7H6W6_9AGAR|nr:hypothetical protein B0H16DRAFT_1742986 [Mycena metata]
MDPLPADTPLPTTPPAPFDDNDDTAATAAHWRELYLRAHHHRCRFADPDPDFEARMASVGASTDPETSVAYVDPRDALSNPHVDSEQVEFEWASANPMPIIQPMGSASRRGVLDDNEWQPLKALKQETPEKK